MTHRLAMPDPDALRTSTPFLAFEGALRLCIDLVTAEQDRLLREGRISPRQRISVLLTNCPPGGVPALEITEDDLGFDSLALLDLVGSMSQYFMLSDSGAEDMLLVHRSLGDWARVVLAHYEKMGVEARVGFETSGTTGAPRRVVHSSRGLEEEVDESLRVILGPLCPESRILSSVPPRHIYGFLWSVLLPQRAGVEVVDLHSSAGEAIFRISRAGDVVVGTPFTWERLARSGGRLPDGLVGVTSAGAATPATWQAASDLGLHRLIEVYGSSETGGVGWRDSGHLPFRLSERMQRVDDKLLWCDPCIEVPLQDELSWENSRSFSVMGRRDGALKIAGVNVSPEEVTRVLRGVEGVVEAAIRVDRGRIRALVVPDGPARNLADLEDRLRAATVRALPAPARPDRYTFADALPRTAMGKLAVW